MRIEEFFQGRRPAREMFDAVTKMMARLGRFETRIGKSQIAFTRTHAFAWIWCPDRYLRGPDVAPLVLSVSLPARDPSPRWKEIVEPAPGRFMHHLELRSPADLDDDIADWLRRAYDCAS